MSNQDKERTGPGLTKSGRIKRPMLRAPDVDKDINNSVKQWEWANRKHRSKFSDKEWEDMKGMIFRSAIKKHDPKLHKILEKQKADRRERNRGVEGLTPEEQKRKADEQSDPNFERDPRIPRWLPRTHASKKKLLMNKRKA